MPAITTTSALRPRRRILALPVEHYDGAVGEGREEEGRRAGNPADGGAGGGADGPLFVEAGVSRGHGVCGYSSAMNGHCRVACVPSQIRSPVEKPRMRSMRSGHAVRRFTSWHVGKAENVTFASGSYVVLISVQHIR